MKSLLSQFAKTFLLPVIKIINHMLRSWTQFFHGVQHKIEWVMTPNPEWYDHYCDQYYQWPVKGTSFWLERGVMSLLALKPNSNLLELCCGDGFNSSHFYINKAKKITALDFEDAAIAHARKYNHHPKINFLKADIRNGIPKDQYDNIVWDAAIEHFTETEISQIMSQIKSSLAKNGILSGYTLLESGTGHKHIEQHEYEFKSKEDLARFLSPHFSNVKIIETIYPERHNLYFFASDSEINI